MQRFFTTLRFVQNDMVHYLPDTVITSCASLIMETV